MSGMMTEALALDEIHVANCRVFPSREVMLEHLPARGIIAEVGSQTGRFAELMLDVCRPQELHIFDHDMTLIRDHGVLPHDPRVGMHEGDSSTELAKMPVGYFDWVYIDANHSYDGVRRDVVAAQTATKPDGYLAFNDYTLWSVLERVPYGVVQVVNEMLVNEGYEMTAFAFQPLGYHDVVLRRRG